MSIPRPALAFTAIYILSTVTAHAGAQLPCGTVIGRGEQMTLTGDVGPCDNDDAAALRVDGGSLDLGGFTVSCADMDADADLPQGVVLFGKKATLRNGRIVGCSNGVGLAGSGKHLVENVTVTGSSDDGFDIAEGTKNKLNNNVASQNASDGYYVRTSKNKLTGNTASQNGDDGFTIAAGGNKNKLSGSTATNNADDGFEIDGSKNKLLATTATQNGESGIDLDGQKNKVIGGSAQGNVVFDVIGCAGNKVKDIGASNPSPDCAR